MKRHSKQQKNFRNDKKKNETVKVMNSNVYRIIFHFNELFRHDAIRKMFKFGLIDAMNIVIVLICSLFTHMIMLGSPSQVVFDEVYFGNFTQYYFQRRYFFDIHPPLGKLLLFLGAKVSGYKPNQVFSTIGADLDKKEIAKLRFWPSFTGSLRAPLIYLTLRLLEINPQWGLVVSIFMSFDSALVVESRFVLIDAFLSFFAVLTMFMCAVVTRKPKRIYIVAILAGIAAGSCVSVKFTGAGVAITLVIVYFIYYPLFKAIALSFVSAIFGFLVFFSSFLIHFMILTKPGPGCKYHRPGFCRKLKNNEIHPISSTINLIKIMLSSNFAISVKHSFSSKWWQWPFMLGRGTYLWLGSGQIWCIGSPVVWLSSTIGIILFVFLLIKWNIRPKIWILFGYLISYLPFSLIKRVLWNYHYFIPLIYALLALATCLNEFLPKAKILPIILITIVIAVYIIYFPIIYGKPITDSYFSKIMPDKWVY